MDIPMNTPIKPYKPSDWVIEPGTPEHDAYMAAKATQAETQKPATQEPCALKTPEQVLAEFARRGESISNWARERRLPASIVFDVLSGRVKGIRGNAHRAAVLLGLKEGEVTEQRQAA